MTDATRLETDDCWALLRTVDVGRLAVVVSGQPEIFPVNFVVDHGTVVFRTAGGGKLDALLSAPLVAFEVDGRVPGEPDEAWSVVLKGRTGEVRRLVDVVATADLPLFPWHASPKGRFIRIVPHDVTGRRFRVAEAGFWDTTFTGLARAADE